MSIKGSSYARFQHALRAGNLTTIRAAAAELPYVDLTDALRVCLAMSHARDPAFDRAAVRWLARVCLEHPDVALGDIRLAASALHTLDSEQSDARTTLASVCDRISLPTAARILRAR